MRTTLRHVNLLYRPATSDQNAKELLPGDIIECTDIAVHEVDPVTMQARPWLQCFEILDESRLVRVKRDSWAQAVKK